MFFKMFLMHKRRLDRTPFRQRIVNMPDIISEGLEFIINFIIYPGNTDMEVKFIYIDFLEKPGKFLPKAIIKK